MAARRWMTVDGLMLLGWLGLVPALPIVATMIPA